MSTVVEESSSRQSTSSAERLRTTMAAVRVSLSWFGVRKTLTPEQKAQAAATFAAEGDYLSAAKRLLDTRHPAFKPVTAVKNRAIAYWRSMSLPFPEQGIRLIRQDRVEAFAAQMGEFQDELKEAVRNLGNHYSDLRRAARNRLGTLYNPADYPDSLVGMFAIEHDFPSVDAPDYLRQLNPQLYEQECRRVQERFSEAVRMAEEAFISELAKIVSHLTERLSGQEDGKPKVFRDSAVNNLVEFFERFRRLNIRSSPELDALVEQAQQTINGVEPQTLRDSNRLRQMVARDFEQIQAAVGDLLVDRPRRNILRRGGVGGAA